MESQPVRQFLCGQPVLPPPNGQMSCSSWRPALLLGAGQTDFARAMHQAGSIEKIRPSVGVKGESE